MRSTATHDPHERLNRRASRLAGRVALGLLISVAMHGAAAAERITIATNQTAILLYIAQSRGYFRDQGLDVELQLSPSGPNSVNAVIEGHADFSTNAETPFVIRSFEHSDLRVLATISASDTIRLIARGDRRIKTPQDLAGKRIGVTRGSVGDYFLSRYLLLNGVPAAAATIVDLEPEQISKNLAKGDIDAALTWEPFIRNAELALEDNVVTPPEQYDRFFYVMLVCMQSWLDAHPSEARAILRAIIQAETYAAEHPSEAKQLVRKMFNMSIDHIDYVWSLHNLYVSLPQALMFALEQQAEWHVRSRLTDARTIPNYLDFVVTAPLSELRQSRVGIVK